MRLECVIGRESADGLYTPLCYLTSRMVEELIISGCNSIAFSALVFYPVFMSGSFVNFFLVMFCTMSIGISKSTPPLIRDLPTPLSPPRGSFLECGTSSASIRGGSEHCMSSRLHDALLPSC